MEIRVLDGYCLNPGDLSWEEMGRLGNLVVYDRTSPAELLERAKDAEVLIANKTLITAENMAALPKLKYIGVLATGYNVVDIEAAKERGIIVTDGLCPFIEHHPTSKLLCRKEPPGSLVGQCRFLLLGFLFDGA